MDWRNLLANPHDLLSYHVPITAAFTAACLAELHGISAETLAERTTTNARAFFRLAVDG